METACGVKCSAVQDGRRVWLYACSQLRTHTPRVFPICYHGRLGRTDVMRCASEMSTKLQSHTYPVISCLRRGQRMESERLKVVPR